MVLSISTIRIANFLSRKFYPKEGLQVGSAIVSAWDALRTKNVIGGDDVATTADWVEDVTDATL